MTENRLTEAEFLGDSTIEYVLYPRTDFATVLDADQHPSQQAAVAAWFALFFHGEAIPLPNPPPKAWEGTNESLRVFDDNPLPDTPPQAGPLAGETPVAKSPTELCPMNLAVGCACAPFWSKRTKPNRSLPRRGRAGERAKVNG